MLPNSGGVALGVHVVVEGIHEGCVCVCVC